MFFLAIPKGLCKNSSHIMNMVVISLSKILFGSYIVRYNEIDCEFQYIFLFLLYIMQRILQNLIINNLNCVFGANVSVMVLQGCKSTPQKSRPIESGHGRHAVQVANVCSYKLG